MMSLTYAERRHVRKRRRDPELLTGAGLLAVVICLCLIVPIVWTWGPNDITGNAYAPPSWAHPFGTDEVGRDVFARVLVGGRLDIVITVIVVLVSLLVGTLVGIVAGTARHRSIDIVLMRLVDAIIAIPFIVLILALATVFGTQRSLGPLPAGAPGIVVAVTLVGWSVYARLARAQVQTLAAQDYIVAVELLGLPRMRIIRRHLAPDVLRVTATYAVADAITTVVGVAGLSFIGAGVQAPTAEWGALMFEGRGVLATAWWITVIPGIFVAITGLGLVLTADSVLSYDRGRRAG